MIPHYVNGVERVLDVKFADDGRLLVLVALTSRGCRHDAKRHDYARARLVYKRDGEMFRQEFGRWKGGNAASLTAEIDDERWEYADKVYNEDPPRWTYERAYVNVDRMALARYLAHVKAVAGKVYDEQALAAVNVHPRGASLWSLGPASLVHRDRVADSSPDARDGLTPEPVVVFAARLRQVVAELSGSRVRLSYDPRSQELRVDKSPVWLARVEASRLAVVPPVHTYPVKDALARAATFASSDDARPTLACVQVEFDAACVSLWASDGHTVYVERVSCTVACSDFGEGAYLPSAVVQRCLKQAKGAEVEIGRAVGRAFVKVPGKIEAFCEPEQTPNLKYFVYGRFAPKDATIVLSAEQVRSWAALFAQLDEDETIRVHFGRSEDGERGAVRVCSYLDGDGPAYIGDASLLAPLESMQVKKHFNPLVVDRAWKVDLLARCLDALADGEVKVLLDADPLAPMMLRQPDRSIVVAPCRLEDAS